jgi:hypothetical protein
MKLNDYDPFAPEPELSSLTRGYRVFEPVWNEEGSSFNLRDPEDFMNRPCDDVIDYE